MEEAKVRIEGNRCRDRRSVGSSGHDHGGVRLRQLRLLCEFVALACLSGKMVLSVLMASIFHTANVLGDFEPQRGDRVEFEIQESKLKPGNDEGFSVKLLN